VLAKGNRKDIPGTGKAVAELGFLSCGSSFSSIPNPGFRISEPTTAKQRREEKFVVQTFFDAINFTKLKIILISSMLMPSSRATTWAT
jgi:hypothetical protein